MSGLPHGGGCPCGAVRYELWDDPEAIHVCHCRNCQRLSGSAFAVSMIVRTAAMRQTSGRLSARPKPGPSSDAGQQIWQCTLCGTPVWHTNAAHPDFRSVRGGTLDHPPDLTRAVHMYTDARMAGVDIPDGAISFTGAPDD